MILINYIPYFTKRKHPSTKFQHVDKLEDYYNAVKMQSNEKVIPLKHA